MTPAIRYTLIVALGAPVAFVVVTPFVRGAWSIERAPLAVWPLLVAVGAVVGFMTYLKHRSSILLNTLDVPDDERSEAAFMAQLKREAPKSRFARERYELALNIRLEALKVCKPLDEGLLAEQAALEAELRTLRGVPSNK